MVIILLSILGIPLWFLICLIGVALMRRRWLKSRPGAFPCAARLGTGRLELAVKPEHLARAAGPFETPAVPAAVAVSVPSPSPA